MWSILNFFKGILGYLGLYQKSGKLVFLGLDNAGKTTLLGMLKEDKYTQTDSTIHPHTEELTIGNIRFNTFDLGGHEVARKIWKDYLGTVDGVIYMVDAACPDRYEESKEELDLLLDSPELKDVPFVVFGNKIDKKGAAREDEFREYFGLLPHMTFGKDAKTKNPGARKVEVFMCSVVKRVGYADGFQWLSTFLN